MTASTHDDAVHRQFSPQATAYLNSAVHAQGEDLRQMAAIAAAQPGARVLDLGCGGGHVSFHVAPSAASVTAYDLSQQMLDVVAEAARRGLDNLSTCRGKAERLPFADGEFDLVMSRYSTHHWQDPGLGLREAFRVLKPGGTAVFADVVSPGEALLDTWLQMIEALRDTSHVRDYSVAEWTRLLTEAGFTLQGVTPRRLSLEFQSWVTRMRTPDTLVAALRHLLAIAPRAFRDPGRRLVLQRHGHPRGEKARLRPAGAGGSRRIAHGLTALAPAAVKRLQRACHAQAAQRMNGLPRRARSVHPAPARRTRVRSRPARRSIPAWRPALARKRRRRFGLLQPRQRPGHRILDVIAASRLIHPLR